MKCPRCQVSPAGLGVLEEAGDQEFGQFDERLEAATEHLAKTQSTVDEYWDHVDDQGMREAYERVAGHELVGSDPQRMMGQIRNTLLLKMVASHPLDADAELLDQLIRKWDGAKSANTLASGDLESLLGAKELLEGRFVQQSENH